jgi:hypothetical protein
MALFAIFLALVVLKPCHLYPIITMGSKNCIRMYLFNSHLCLLHV